MKTLVAGAVVSLVLAASAAAAGGRYPRPIELPKQTPGVTLVNCWEREDGLQGFVCVEQRPRSPKAVAFTYLVKTDAGLFGARIPQRR